MALLGLFLTVSMTAVSLLPPQLNRILIDDAITPVLKARGELAGPGRRRPRASPC